MRHKSEYLLLGTLSAFALAGAVAMALDDPVVTVRPTVEPPAATYVPSDQDAGAWFAAARPHCNPVEVEVHLRAQPAPATNEGRMHEAACYALAGHIGDARRVIESLPPELRYQAAGVVFNVGHPAADAGDDLAAGPLMELVVEYWPNHYMALYHAGAAAFERGEYGPAWDYLERFLAEYSVEDGWRKNAELMLETMTVISG